MPHAPFCRLYGCVEPFEMGHRAFLMPQSCPEGVRMALVGCRMWGMRLCTVYFCLSNSY